MITMLRTEKYSCFYPFRKSDGKSHTFNFHINIAFRFQNIVFLSKVMNLKRKKGHISSLQSLPS